MENTLILLDLKLKIYSFTGMYIKKYNIHIIINEKILLFHSGKIYIQIAKKFVYALFLMQILFLNVSFNLEIYYFYLNK